MPALHFSELTVVHLVGIDHNLFVILWHTWSLNNKVDVGSFRQLQIVNMVNILPLQINSNYTLLPIQQVCPNAIATASVAQQSEDRKESKGSKFPIHFVKLIIYCQKTKKYIINCLVELL